MDETALKIECFELSFNILNSNSHYTNKQNSYSLLNRNFVITLFWLYNSKLNELLKVSHGET